MNDDKEVTVEVTQEDMEFRARAKAAGLPDIIISMYGTALSRLVADEREACARACEGQDEADARFRYDYRRGVCDCVDAIRARSKG